MKLENIGFYTLSNARARNVSWTSDLQRCELILTNRCNFKCPYCRGIAKPFQGDLTLAQAKEVVNLWTSGNLHNIRFSGGEPTIWAPLLELVRYTRTFACIEHIALSTNGSASLEYYLKLAAVGVNDFSISLDACCAATADVMAGVNGNFVHTCEIIRELSKITYVTAGVVLTQQNNAELQAIIEHATALGVKDIRIIPSAQSNHHLETSIKTKFPILHYRINNLCNGRHVRGLQPSDCNKCHLVKDDMVVLQDQHFPCVIYMREQGAPIGTTTGKSLAQIRAERRGWFETTNIQLDPICKRNCLDVCIDHNNQVDRYVQH